ncbi:MAG: riboflavin kinase, partial [Rhodospirillales bacterium]|nr:riboflavin kinase [Rhodospirillales bacterium]
PTFAGNDLVLEVHLLAFQGTLYGRRLRVALIEHLREEKKFDGIASLKAQIAKDCARAIEILARRDTDAPHESGPPRIERMKP